MKGRRMAPALSELLGLWPGRTLFLARQQVDPFQGVEL